MKIAWAREEDCEQMCEYAKNLGFGLVWLWLGMA
jgi:hypothetical protein